MKKVVILGAGESGNGAALLAQQQGYSVFVSDFGSIQERFKKELQQWGIAFEENGHDLEKVRSADIIIKSPGIPEKASVIKEIREKGIEIISEIEWAYRFKGESKIVAITGSNGKTTTTSLIYHIFKNCGLDVAMVGNIGYSFARQIAEQPREWYVAEISSFQLDDISTFKPDIALILNITPDHLDRYDYKFENYVASKFNIAAYQTSENILILNQDDDAITDTLAILKNPALYLACLLLSSL